VLLGLREVAQGRAAKPLREIGGQTGTAFRQAAAVEENLGALGWAISEADMAAIDAIFARHGAVTVPPGWLEDD